MTAVDSAPAVARRRPLGGPARVAGRRAVAAYVALTKPRIIELLLVTTVPAMFLAAGRRARRSGWSSPRWSAGRWRRAARTRSTASSTATSTRSCAAPSGARWPPAPVTPRDGAGLRARPRRASRSGCWLADRTWLAAVLALAAIVFYVFVYTMVLKRRTPQNIVWGGAAGCMPVLIGWAAVTGSLRWAPVVLFGVIFFWTPPHYWPLAMRFRDDYAAAGVPMLPVVAHRGAVARQIVAYSWAMVACSLLLWPVAAPAVLRRRGAVLGGAFLVEAHLLGPAGPPRFRRAVEAADAAVPRLDHLPDAAVPRRRARPAAAVLSAEPGPLGAHLPSPLVGSTAAPTHGGSASERRRVAAAGCGRVGGVRGRWSSLLPGGAAGSGRRGAGAAASVLRAAAGGGLGRAVPRWRRWSGRAGRPAPDDGRRPRRSAGRSTGRGSGRRRGRSSPGVGRR